MQKKSYPKSSATSKKSPYYEGDGSTKSKKSSKNWKKYGKSELKAYLGY